MRDAIERLMHHSRTTTGKRMIRFTMVSIISTVISFTILFIVYGVFRLWTEVPSALFANLCGLVPSYQLNRRWTWGKSGRSHLLREVLPFWTASTAGIVFSVLAAAEARQYGIAHALDHAQRTALVLSANLGAFGLLWVLKFLFFNRLFHITPEAELERELRSPSPGNS